MLRIFAAAALLSLPGTILAQQAPPATPAPAASVPDAQAQTGRPPQRIRSVTLTGDEKCPKAASTDEIVVCSTLSPDEQYRVPKALRQSKPSAAQQSWVNRAATMDEIGRRAGGLPNTCSPVGSGGQTGCMQQMLSDYAAEKAEKKREDSAIP